MTLELDHETTFLFDIGNVILHFDWRRFADAVATDSDCTAQHLLELIEDPKLEMEANQLDEDGFLRLAFDLIGYRGEREHFVTAWQEIFWLNEPIAEWIDQLSAAGHRLCLLSNTNEAHARYFMKEFPVFGRFDGRVFSHEAGLMKPDPRIYAHAIEKLDLDPAKTVYLDDLQENIDGGIAAGFRSVCYVDQEPAEILRLARAQA